MNLTMWKRISLTIFAVYVTAIYFLSSNHEICTSISDALGLYYYMRDFCHDFRFLPSFLLGSLVLTILILWENNLKKILSNLKMPNDETLNLKRKASTINSNPIFDQTFAERQKNGDEIIIKVVQGLMDFEEEIKKGMEPKEKIIHLSFTQKKIIIHHDSNYSIIVKKDRETVLRFDGELKAITLQKNIAEEILPLGLNISLAYKIFSMGKGKVLLEKNY